MSVLDQHSAIEQWCDLLDQYEQHLDAQAAALGDLASTENLDDDVVSDVPEFVIPADLPAAPEALLERMVELQQRTLQLEQHSSHLLSTLERPQIRRRNAPEATVATLLDRAL